MASDITLNDNDVVVEGTQVTFDRGPEQTSVALNLKNPKGFWHISGPRSFEPNSPPSIFWHNNSNFSRSFLTVNTLGNIGIGTTNPTNKLHVVGNRFSFKSLRSPNLQLLGVQKNSALRIEGLGVQI